MIDRPADQSARPIDALRRRARLLAPLAVFAALAFAFFDRLRSGDDPARIPSPLVNKPAPDLDLPPLQNVFIDRQPVPGLKRADLLGQVTLVNVWASWCIPCRDEHPVLERLATDTRFRVVGLNFKDQPDNARRFLNQYGNPFRNIGVDASGRTGIEWGVYGVPETFLVDAAGTIRYKFVGPLTDRSVAAMLMPEIEKVLAGTAG